jgi:hypothetical protein
MFLVYVHFDFDSSHETRFWMFILGTFNLKRGDHKERNKEGEYGVSTMYSCM